MIRLNPTFRDVDFIRYNLNILLTKWQMSIIDIVTVILNLQIVIEKFFLRRISFDFCQDKIKYFWAVLCFWFSFCILIKDVLSVR